jgi:hypothetical protein
VVGAVPRARGAGKPHLASALKAPQTLRRRIRVEICANPELSLHTAKTRVMDREIINCIQYVIVWVGGCCNMCVYAYIHTCIHACMHAYIHTYIHIGPTGETCVACEAGTYKNTTGSQACSDCGPGRYQVA